MTETKCFRDGFRDQLHELSGQPNITSDQVKSSQNPFITKSSHYVIFFSSQIIEQVKSCSKNYFKDFEDILYNFIQPNILR